MLKDFEPEGIRIRSRLAEDDLPVGSPDLFVIPTRQLPEKWRISEPHGVSRWLESRLPELGMWAQTTFGEAAWDQDPAIEPSLKAFAANTLQTCMVDRNIRFDPVKAGEPAPAITIRTLDHEDFLVAIRIENLESKPVETTLRLFLCAAEGEHRHNRRLWMELDKFVYTAPPGKSVAIQPVTTFSVVRNPAGHLGIDGNLGDDYPLGDDEQDLSDFSYCNCGLPYTLLLPRGREKGMQFALYVIATRTGDDLVRASPCGSMSFCGTRDEYPDRREMGFPFNRPIHDWESLLQGPNRAWREITISQGEAPPGWSTSKSG